MVNHMIIVITIKRSHLLSIRVHHYCRHNYSPIYMSMTTANRTPTNVNVSFVFLCFDI